MTDTGFKSAIVTAAAVFLAVFIAIVMPPLIVEPDIVGALAAGFVNPYAAGYSTDTIACWVILSAWILHERRSRPAPHALWCIPLGLFPGVAVAFALYLLLRMRRDNRVET